MAVCTTVHGPVDQFTNKRHKLSAKQSVQIILLQRIWHRKDQTRPDKTRHRSTIDDRDRDNADKAWGEGEEVRERGGAIESGKLCNCIAKVAIVAEMRWECELSWAELELSRANGRAWMGLACGGEPVSTVASQIQIQLQQQLQQQIQIHFYTAAEVRRSRVDGDGWWLTAFCKRFEVQVRCNSA